MSEGDDGFWNVDALKADEKSEYWKREYLRKQKSCVNELAKIPQLWTSYAGYLKQVG